jgi:hypothetical protein
MPRASASNSGVLRFTTPGTPSPRMSSVVIRMTTGGAGFARTRRHLDNLVAALRHRAEPLSYVSEVSTSPASGGSGKSAGVEVARIGPEHAVADAARVDSLTTA